jgi:DNA polymerase III alpha subunit
MNNGKSIVEHIVELRKKQPAIKPIEQPITKAPPTTIVQPTVLPIAASNTLDAVPKSLPAVEQKNDSAINDNLITLITEQRRQNRLLEQVIAAINTTNALLTQLVQR